MQNEKVGYITMTKEEFDKVVEVVAKKIFEFDDLLDVAYSEQYTSEEILSMYKDKYFGNLWSNFREDVKNNPEHFGDCNNNPCPCLQCIYERFIKEAKEELEKGGIKFEN